MGFRGGSFSGFTKNFTELNKEILNKNDIPHIAATYCALCILKVCGYNINDEKEKNDYMGVLEEIGKCQTDRGSITAQLWDTEDDPRFMYCACAIHRLLGVKSEDKFSFDKDKAKSYLETLISYEGGYGMESDSEANAGLTYCSVGSLVLMGFDNEINNKEKLIFWLANRFHDIGVNGRTNKVTDSCYSFWVMATLCILGKLIYYKLYL